jgi:hypothetical protein
MGQDERTVVGGPVRVLLQPDPMFRTANANAKHWQCNANYFFWFQYMIEGRKE